MGLMSRAIRHNQSGIMTVIIYTHRPLRGHQVQSRPLRGQRRIRSSRRSAAIGPAAAAQPGIGGDVVSRGWERDCPLRDSLGYYYEHQQRQVAGLECHRPSRICWRPKARVQSQNETITTKLGGGSNSVPNRDDHCRRSPLSSGAAASSEKRRPQ